MAKLVEELVVIKKWETETMILRLDPHGLGPLPVIIMYIMIYHIYLYL